MMGQPCGRVNKEVAIEQFGTRAGLDGFSVSRLLTHRPMCEAGTLGTFQPGARTADVGPWPLVTMPGVCQRRRHAHSRGPTTWRRRSDRQTAPGDHRRMGRGNRGTTARPVPAAAPEQLRERQLGKGWRLRAIRVGKLTSGCSGTLWKAAARITDSQGGDDDDPSSGRSLWRAAVGCGPRRSPRLGLRLL